MASQIRSKKVLDNVSPYKSSEINFEFYVSHKSAFETGDLIFFSGNHWLSGLIRWRSKSVWSHIGIVVKIEELDRLFLIESIIESGVRMIPLSSVFKDYSGNKLGYNGRVAWAKHEAMTSKPEVKYAIREFCMSNLSKQYDRKEYWRILWRSFMGREKFFEDEKYTCAELIYEAFKHANIKLPKERGVFISPGAFWKQPEVVMKAIIV